MSLKLRLATHRDASRIVDLHLAAFATNGMLLAQFPTPPVREEFRKSLVSKTTREICDPHMAVLLIHDTELNGKVISFAKWILPSTASESRAPWIWPEGTRLDILDEWAGRVESVKTKILKDEDCYRRTSILPIYFRKSGSNESVFHRLTAESSGLAFIATDSHHERRGAATMLVKWALDRCIKEEVPAYLESTAIAGPFYEKLGFISEEKITMTFETGSTYEEIAYVFRPSVDVAQEALT